MSLYESWMKKAFTQKGQSVDAVWDEYLPLEQKIYEYILSEKIQDMDCKISDIAKKFNIFQNFLIICICTLTLLICTCCLSYFFNTKRPFRNFHSK